MANDMLLTQLQETGSVDFEYGTCLAEIMEYADALGIKPTELFLRGIDLGKGTIRLIARVKNEEPGEVVKHAFWCKSLRPGEPEICNCHWGG